MPSRRDVLPVLAWGLALGLHGESHAGSQIEEPLSDAVRSALNTAVTGAAPPELVLPARSTAKTTNAGNCTAASG